MNRANAHHVNGLGERFDEGFGGRLAAVARMSKDVFKISWASYGFDVIRTKLHFCN